MSSEQHHHLPGSAGHYSGRNKIPNIHEFVESLDREKRERDARIDAQLKENRRAGTIQDHQPSSPRKGRIVSDPVTGNQVEIADVDADFMKSVDEPMVSKLAHASSPGLPSPAVC